MTKVNSSNKGIARALLCVENTYGKNCSCPIDFLIDIFKGSPLPFISNTCRHCKKLHKLIDLVLNFEDDFEEEEEEPTFQISLTLPPTPFEKMLAYAQALDPKYFLFFETPQEGRL